MDKIKAVTVLLSMPRLCWRQHVMNCWRSKIMGAPEVGNDLMAQGEIKFGIDSEKKAIASLEFISAQNHVEYKEPNCNDHVINAWQLTGKLNL
jgi:hypothetical protein